MGLWEQIVKGKVRRCIDSKAVSYDYANNLAKDIAAELKNGKIIYSRDWLSFVNNKGSNFMAKTPFIGFGDNGSYLYEEIDRKDIEHIYTIRISISQDGLKGTIKSSLGSYFDLNKVYLTIDLQFEKLDK